MFLLHYLFACSESTPDLILKDVLPVLEAPAYNRVKGRHILIAYQKAWRAETPRNKVEAIKKATQIQNWALEGYDFGDLALKYSDDPSYIQKGYIGLIQPGDMIIEFENALFSLDYNEISELVETGFGYHIIQRLPLDEAELYHILVQWEGASRSKVSRSKEEARARAKLVDEELMILPPSAIAKLYSDGPMGSRGGYLGWIERNELDPDFAKTIFALSPQECSSALEGQHGFHFFCLNNKSP